jgi:hypothetical protein
VAVVEPHKLITRAEILWQRYIDLRRIAEDTGRFEDALAAGRASRDFYIAFVPELAPEPKPPIPFNGRASK